MAAQHDPNGNVPAFRELFAGNGLVPNIALILLRCRLECAEAVAQPAVMEGA